MNLINNIHKIAFKADPQASTAANVTSQSVQSNQPKEEGLERIPKKDEFAPSTQVASENPISTENKPTKTSIFYLADLHGRMSNMERILSISKRFDTETDGTKVDKLKLASGDIILGSSPSVNRVANNFLNWVGITANALGNHELDATPKAFAETLGEAKYKLLAANAHVNPNSAMQGKIEKSVIEEHNGQKYGIIGTAPPDVLERVGTRESLEDIKVDDMETTIKTVQEEVNNLKAQGVNKIIVVSHIGKTLDKRLAQETSGIDVILGAHTHDLYKGVKENENLLYSKSNEPVILTQSGKDGEHAGVLNLEFSAEGIITKAQNNLFRTGGFSRTLPGKAAVESIIGKPEVLGTIKYAAPPPKNRLIENNPHGNIIADAIKHELKTDIALVNSGNIRSTFSEGTVDSRKINDITPFYDMMTICSLTEKQIVDAINVGAKSFIDKGSKPGILLVSGLEYTVTDKGKLLNLNFIDKDGNKKPIDVNNPSPDKKYTVACDDFVALGGDNYLPVMKNPDFIVNKFDVDKNVYTANYIKNLNVPIEIKDDGRIKIVKE